MRQSIHLSLPVALKSWVRTQSKDGGYSTVSEFIRDVLRREQKRSLRSAIDAKLLEAVESNSSKPMTDEDWKNIRKKGQEKLNKLRKKTK